MILERYLDSERSRRIAYVFLIGLFGLLYLAVLGERPLFIPDEPRYGEIAREMLVSGDWVVPRLNGLLYFEKPPFGHWLNAISLYMFGETPFAVRFASAFSTGMSAVLVFYLARYFVESRVVPFLAVFIFLTTLEVQVIGTFSVLDPAFSLVLNAGIAVMVISAYATGRRRLWMLVLAGVLFGLAFLTKGFLALALPVLVLVPWLLIRKDYVFLFQHAWIAIVFAALTIAPWALAIHVDQPDFWRYFFWVEHIQRFASEIAQHKEPFYYFLMYLPVLAFPWIFLLPAVLKGLRGEDKSAAKPGMTLLLALWAVVPFVFFSIASGKLSTYILPCFVPFSILTAIGLSSIAVPLRGMKLSLIVASAAVGLFLVALIVYVGNSEDRVFSPTELIKQMALYGSLAVMAGLLLFAATTMKAHFRIVTVGVSIIPFMVALPLSMSDSILGGKAPEAFIKDTVSQVPENTALVTNGSLVRAMSWSAKRTDIFVIENGGETTYGLAAPDGTGRFLSPDALRELLASETSVLIVCKGPCNSTTTDVLPSHTVSTSRGNFYAHHIVTKPASKVVATSE